MAKMHVAGNALVRQRDAEHLYHDLRVGTYEPDLGVRVERILLGSHTFVIYVDAEERFHVAFNEHTGVDRDRSYAEAIALEAQLDAVGKIRPAIVAEGRHLIAAALSNAFDHRKADDTIPFFADAQTFVSTKAAETTQGFYVFSALLAALYFVLAIPYAELLGMAPTHREWALAAGFGAIGAMLSVLQRFRSIGASPYSTPTFVMLDGCMRIILGAVLATVLLLLLRSGWLSIRAENVYAIGLFAVIAGFNERFIPNLLERVASTVEKDKALKEPGRKEEPGKHQQQKPRKTPGKSGVRRGHQRHREHLDRRGHRGRGGHR